MQITQDSRLFGIGIYNGCLALQKQGIMYVFKDISPKRLAMDAMSPYMRTLRKHNYKVMYVSNKQLLDMSCYLYEIKELVFDRKAGTRYKGKGWLGSYLFCLRDGVQPTPVKR